MIIEKKIFTDRKKEQVVFDPGKILNRHTETVGGVESTISKHYDVGSI